MAQSILIEGQLIEKTGELALQLNKRIQVNILAETARQKVNLFVHMEISTQMHAETPMLVINQDNDVTWRVPIHLTFPAFGDVGCVGFIYVDPVTGKMDTSPAATTELIHHAEAIARRFTSPATRPLSNL